MPQSKAPRRGLVSSLPAGTIQSYGVKPHPREAKAKPATTRLITDPKEARELNVRVGDAVRIEPPAPKFKPRSPAPAKKAPAKKVKR